MLMVTLHQHRGTNRRIPLAKRRNKQRTLCVPRLPLKDNVKIAAAGRGRGASD